MPRLETTMRSNITIRKVFGQVTCDELISALRDSYANPITGYWIWDLSEADTKQITSADAQRIAEFASANTHIKPKGRTAIIAPTDLTFGMSRVFEIYSELASVPVQVKICRTQSEALGWMDEQEVRQVGR